MGVSFPSVVKKELLVAQVIAHLDAELDRYAKAARVAHSEATDEQSRAENKYDTRGLEASYLAHGQSRQVVETEQAREQFLALLVREFRADEPIAIGAFVQLETEGERLWYFLGPAAGGTEVTCEDQEVLVITPQSPLGRLLMGRRCGEIVASGAGKTRTDHRILSVR